MKDQAAEAIVANVASKVTYGGGAGALWGVYTASDIAAFIGVTVAILGFLVNLYFKRKDDKRSAEYHSRRMAELDE